jgi:uncharacterized protein YdhG (YjbR/CyaY superfamily)
MKKPQTIDDYISQYPKNVQEKLQELRFVIRKNAPDAEEKISYGLATFFLYGNLIHFGAFKNHIGLYATPSGNEMFKKELSKYTVSKGTVQFPLDAKLPVTLIARMVKFRVKENLQKKPQSEFPKTSAPTSRALENANVKTLKALSKWTEKDILKLHGIGPASIPILRKALKEKGLSFK